MRKLLLLAVALAGCGTPYVNGWGEEEEDTRTPEQKCEAREGWSWGGEACAKDEEIALTELTESQCRNIATAVWLDDRCIAYSMLSEEQCTRAANSNWTWYEGCRPVKEVECLKLGADYRYRNGRCDQLPKDEPKPDPTASGFAKLCKDPPNHEVARTVAILIEAMDKIDCDEAATALSLVTKLDLKGADLVDLSPLNGLTRLNTVLLIDNARLTDLSPLASIPQLTLLDLRGSLEVADLSPLATSKSLRFLLIDDTKLANDPSLKTDANCPVADGTNQAVRRFCVERP